MISCDFTGNDDIINLMLLADAVRRRNQVDGRTPGIALNIPYLPCARQDRVCAEVEPLSIKVSDGIQGHSSWRR